MYIKAIIVFSLAIMLAGGAISIADSSVTAGSSNSVSLGNFSFNVASNGTLGNMSYTNEGMNYTFAQYLSAQGSNVSSFFGNASSTGTLKFSTPNATFLTSMESNTLVVVSKENAQGKLGLKVRVNGTAHTDFNGKTDLGLDFMDGISFQSSIWTVLQISNPDFTGYFITDGSASISGSNITVTAVNDLPKIGDLSGNVIISGFTTQAHLDKLLEHMEKRNNHFFSYNSTTGVVNGTFLGFNFDNATGVISNFTANVLNHTRIFNSISASGNGTIGSKKYLSLFSNESARVFGSLFLDTNVSYVYAIHNNPTLNTGALLDNGTMKFNVASGLNVTLIHMNANEQTSLNASVVSSDPSVEINTTFGLSTSVDATATAYLIHGHGFRGILYLNGYKNTSYNSTTDTITVVASNSSIAQIHFVAPPGFQSLNGLKADLLKYALIHEKLAAELTIENLGTGAYNLTTYFNSSVHVNLTHVTRGSISFILSSSQHSGNSVAVFINSSFLSSSGKLYVYFDGKIATLSASTNATINATSTSIAYYSVEQVSGGYVVIIHAPHFSTHNVTISSTPLNTTSPLSGLSDLEMGGIAAIIIVIVALAAIGIRRKK